MSVAALAGEIRRAIAAFPLPALDHADQMLTEARTGFVEVTRGSNAAEQRNG